MKVGKISETVLKRSIFKQIHTKRDEVLLGAGVGEDCAAVKLAPGEIFVISTDPITGTVKDVGMLAIQITANDLASSGAWYHVGIGQGDRFSNCQRLFVLIVGNQGNGRRLGGSTTHGDCVFQI